MPVPEPVSTYQDFRKQRDARKRAIFDLRREIDSLDEHFLLALLSKLEKRLRPDVNAWVCARFIGIPTYAKIDLEQQPMARVHAIWWFEMIDQHTERGEAVTFNTSVFNYQHETEARSQLDRIVECFRDVGFDLSCVWGGNQNHNVFAQLRVLRSEPATQSQQQGA